MFLWRLDEPFPYLILDARYERIREGRAVAALAVLIAVAVPGTAGGRCRPSELANREGAKSWRRFLITAKGVRPARRRVRGLRRPSRAAPGHPRGAD